MEKEDLKRVWEMSLKELAIMRANYEEAISFLKKTSKKSCELVECSACDALKLLRKFGEEK